MAWTSEWPKVGDQNLGLSVINELNDELNLRAGTSYEGFLACSSLWTALVLLHGRVYAQLPSFANPDTGYKWALPGQIEVLTGTWTDRRNNIFKKVFGGDRLRWLKNGTGGEGSTPDSCCEPYAFFLNELHDIIDAMTWKYGAATDALAVSRDADATEATKQASLNTAWAGYEACAEVLSSGNAVLQGDYGMFAGPDYYCFVGGRHAFGSLALPATVTAMKAFVFQIRGSHYYKDVDGAPVDAALPSWPLAFRIGSVNPAPLGAGDWNYGAAAGSVDINQYAPFTFLETVTPVEPAAVADLAGYTQGATNWVQLQPGTGQKPQCIVDDGYWDPLSSVNFHQVVHAVTDIRFLWRII